MEDDALAVLGANRSPVGGDNVYLPIQHRAVEPGESTRIGTVDSDEGQASDGHAGQDIDGWRLRRYYYRLTESGAAALTTQVARLRRNADAAAIRLRQALGGTGRHLLFELPDSVLFREKVDQLPPREVVDCITP
jgi:hypothetical protein